MRCQTNGAAALALAIAPLWFHASAQEPPEALEEVRKFSFGVETDFNSAYVWRGMVVNDQPVMQPSAWVSWSRFTVGAWGNLALTDIPGTARLQAANLVLGYEFPWKKLTVEPGLEAYRWSEDIGGRGTMEAALKLSYQSGPFHVFTIHAFDILTYRGSYFGQAGLGYEGPVTKTSWLAVYIRSGWASSRFNDVYIGIEKRALNFIGAESSLTYYLKPHLYVRPSFYFTNVTDGRLREYLSSPRLVNVGVALGVEF